MKFSAVALTPNAALQTDKGKLGGSLRRSGWKKVRAVLRLLKEDGWEQAGLK